MGSLCSAAELTSRVGRCPENAKRGRHCCRPPVAGLRSVIDASRDGRAGRSGFGGSRCRTTRTLTGGRSPGPGVDVLGRTPRFRPRRPARNKDAKSSFLASVTLALLVRRPEGRLCRGSDGDPSHAHRREQRRSCDFGNALCVARSSNTLARFARSAATRPAFPARDRVSFLSAPTVSTVASV